MPLDLAQVADAVRVCQRCPLHTTRTNAVPGVGKHTARIVFVGEGPGRHEDEQGLPFVGRAGQLLDRLLASIGVLRTDVFITNIIKCRPPSNRDPLPAEVGACEGYLKTQLDLIQPFVIVTLGRYALNWFFPLEKISQAHGKLFVYNEKFVLLPLYHPAAALRNSNMSQVLERDFKLINKALIAGLKLQSGSPPSRISASANLPTSPTKSPTDADTPDQPDSSQSAML